MTGMPDRERVIDWLHKVGEALAKYVPAKEQDYFKLQQTVDIAIAWIRAQEAVEPTRQKINGEGRLFCGVCKTMIPRWGKYCSECGRKVLRNDH